MRSALVVVALTLCAGPLGLLVTPAAAGGSTRMASGDPPPAPDPENPARVILRGGDLTDPYMFTWQGRDYLYTSQGTSYESVPVRVGTPGHWSAPVNALPALPSWAGGLLTWAPDVYQVAGGWALYFTTLLAGAQWPTHCIGSAFGPSPVGPFVATARPFICQIRHRGTIDARVITVGSRLVMLFKSEDNANPGQPETYPNGPTGIYAQYLSADGRQLIGNPVKILGPTQHWEGTIVEAPDMVKADGWYWLFFSGNWYNSRAYGIGFARCKTPFGPCTDVSSKRFIGSNEQGDGPGEESLFHDGPATYVLYNPFKAGDPGPVVPRPAVMARIGFTAKGPYLAG